MKNRNPWYSLWRIVPSLIILPPLGFVLLWKSPRSPRAKLVVSVLFLAFLTGAFVGSVRTGLYDRYVLHKQPSGDVFDVRMDSRQVYVTDEVLPFERKVFSAVVRQMRTYETRVAPDLTRDIVDLDALVAGTRAFEAVGDEYGLDYEDVQKIYRKVSYLLHKKRK